MSLYWRIVLPFVLGLVLVLGAATWIASTLLNRDADQRLAAHLSTVARRISQAGFALNRPLLEQLKVAVEAEVVVAGAGGEVIAATLEGAESREAASLAMALAGRSASPGSSHAALETVTVGRNEYKALAVPIAGVDTSPQVLALFAPLAPIQAGRDAVARTLALIFLGGLVLMLLWGHIITRSITRPIDRLMASTRAVAGGNLQHQADRPCIPELLSLSNSFNHMVVKIRESEERLVRSERFATTGRIAATVAHEVRNPLTAIRMLAQFIRRSHQEGTPAAVACKSIMTEIDRLEMLVKGLLEATHARPLQLTPLRVGEILQEIVSLTDAQLQHRRIHLTVEEEDGLPEIPADRDRLKQVILNLVLNGAEAMPDGGPLTVSVRRSPSPAGDGQGIELVVADSGTGLSAETEGHAFEPFFTTKPEGAGLGLAVSRRIVEEHGGHISLANRPEGGAVAQVWLPLG